MKKDTTTSDTYYETGTPGKATLSPDTPKKNIAARVYFGLVATIGSAAVVVGLTVGAINGGWAQLAQSLSEMTYWSNILLIFVGFALVLNPQRDGRIFRWLRLSSLVMITVVGIVFPLALAAKADTTGLFAYTSPTLHYFMPWASLLGFVLFGPRPRFTWGTYWSMTILPLLYTVFAMVYGAVLSPLGKYPYSMLNPNFNGPGDPGVTAVAMTIAMILVLGLVVGLIYMGLDRLLSRGAKPADLSGKDSEFEVEEFSVSELESKSNEPMPV